MKANKILLTGGSGFLGKIIRQRLLSGGYLVNDLQAFFNTRIDISKPFSLSGSHDWVIHCAGKAHAMPRNAVEAKVFYEVNDAGTRNLCAALQQLPVLPKAFIFMSTVAVYGIEEGIGIKEDQPLNGTTPYATSKILAEAFLMNWAKAHGIKLGILRLPLIAGPGAPGNLGAMIQGMKSGRYLSVGKGDARKSIVWAEDIATIIPRLTEKEGIYHITDGQHPSFRQLEAAIACSMDRKLPLQIPVGVARILAKIGDVLGATFPVNSGKLHKIMSTLTFDDEKARRQLDWQPTMVIDKIASLL